MFNRWFLLPRRSQSFYSLCVCVFFFSHALLSSSLYIILSTLSSFYISVSYLLCIQICPALTAHVTNTPTNVSRFIAYSTCRTIFTCLNGNHQVIFWAVRFGASRVVFPLYWNNVGIFVTISDFCWKKWILFCFFVSIWQVLLMEISM